MTAVRSLLLAGAAGAAVALALWLAWPDLPERAANGETAGRAAADVESGEYLTRAGNCIGCHTARGRPPFAGGRPIDTPFGVVYSTNLTPDAGTGLGSWSADDFWRALHHGRSKDGRRLNPAFPYTSYTLLRREDSDAIFAYLESLEPVASPRIAPDLEFPYDSELALMVWRALYFRPGTFEPDAARSEVWNRGAYLTEALGHCGACHTPRGRLGGTDEKHAYAGGSIPGTSWYAPPLGGAGRPASEAGEMARLLATGVSRRSAASGPMAEVVFHSLQYLREDDIAAMVEYVATLPEPLAPRRRAPLRPRPDLADAGAGVYREHCRDCHGVDGRGEPYAYPGLAGNAIVTARNPANALRAVLHGGYPPSTQTNPRPYGMPPYSHQLTDDEIAAVLTYIRSAWGNSAPPVLPQQVARY